MTTHDLRAFVRDCERVVASHRLERPGAYCRWTRQPAPDQQGARGAPPGSAGVLDPYGCADAANILYTISRFPRDAAERAGFVETLRGLQDPGSGLFRDATHHEVHTTAHCLAALELFDAGPAHPLAALAAYRDFAAARARFEQLAWSDDPWHASHEGAGLFAALVLADEVDDAWIASWCDLVEAAVDPTTGLLRAGSVPEDPDDWFPHLAGTFHYLFDLEYVRRPLSAPAARIDTCLRIYRERRYDLCRSIGFAEIDWVYCTTRSMRCTDHRFGEARRALEDFCDEYVPLLGTLDTETRTGAWDDLHQLFGVLCAVAELQAALPGRIRTGRPLRLVLDRRPFV